MQVAGTWSVDAAQKIAGYRHALDYAGATWFTGTDGLGELTITGPSAVFSIRDGVVERETLRPEDFGFTPQPAESIQGGDVARNRRDRGVGFEWSEIRRARYRCDERRAGSSGGGDFRCLSSAPPNPSIPGAALAKLEFTSGVAVGANCPRIFSRF